MQRVAILALRSLWLALLAAMVVTLARFITPVSSMFIVGVASHVLMDMTPHFPIYMDYGATTPVDQRVVDAMIPWLREHFGNVSPRPMICIVAKNSPRK